MQVPGPVDAGEVSHRAYQSAIGLFILSCSHERGPQHAFGVVSFPGIAMNLLANIQVPLQQEPGLLLFRWDAVACCIEL